MRTWIDIQVHGTEGGFDGHGSQLLMQGECSKLSIVGQLGKLRPIVNRPDAALAPDGGGSQPPRRLPAQCHIVFVGWDFSFCDWGIGLPCSTPREDTRGACVCVEVAWLVARST